MSKKWISLSVLGLLFLLTTACGKSLDEVKQGADTVDGICQEARAAGAGQCDAASAKLKEGEAKAKELRAAIDAGDVDKASELLDAAKAACEEAKSIAKSDKCEGVTGKAVNVANMTDTDLEAELKGKSVEAVVKGYIPTIYFDYDKADLTSEAKTSLDGAARVLKLREDVSLSIGGHCDERGTEEYNRVLGARRAEAAKKYLTGKGTAGSRLSTTSYGEDEAVDPGHNEAAWSKNRRDEFKAR